MAQDPLKPRDNGKIGVGKIAPGMNKLPPLNVVGGKGDPKADEASRLMGKRDASKDQKLLQEALKRFEACLTAESPNRKAAREDLKFKAGEQWHSDDQAQRQADGRPCLTINQIPTFIHQVTNELRAERPSMTFSPMGDQGDKEVAKMYRGLVRSIEKDSHADIAYDTGVDCAVSMGWGYWRICTEYDEPESFDQNVVIKRVRNPFTIYMDPNAQDPTGCDADYCFVSEMIPRDEFTDRWPDASPMPFLAGGIGEQQSNWQTADQVRVAEYFRTKITTRRLVRLSNGHIGWHDELAEDVRDKLASGELTITKDRESECRKIEWYLISGVEVLEEREWLGQHMPVIRCIGDELDLDGKVSFIGLIRYAKDPQRMLNYWRTLQTERVALAPKAKWLVAEGQIEGHEDVWKNANRTNDASLPYKPDSIGDKMVPPPTRISAEGVDAGVENSLQGARQDMMATTGIRFDATLQERVRDESGRALRELQRHGDIGAYHFVDNFCRALRQTGVVLIDLIPKVYDAPRMITILREDDTNEQVKLQPGSGKPFQEGQRMGPDGKPQKLKIFDPTYGRYGVAVTIGPSFATKRIEASESLLDFMRALGPQMGPMVADLVAKNQDWPGSEQLAARLQMLVPPHLQTAGAMKDIPPQAAAMIQSMGHQMQQLMVERQKMMLALRDKQGDQAIKIDKINKDFEAKLLAIVQKADAKGHDAATQQAAHLAEAANALAIGLQGSPPANGAATLQ